ncbi:MAG: hypothetical protein ACLFO5_03520 [Opitutales bacterium]
MRCNNGEHGVRVKHAFAKRCAVLAMCGFLFNLPRMADFFKQAFRWFFGWLFYVCLICFGGAAFGALTHLGYALFFAGEGADYLFYIAFGFFNGLQYAGVWAGGVSLVLCVMRAREEYLARREKGDFRRTHEMREAASDEVG